MCGRIVQKRNINDYLEKIIRAPTPGEVFAQDYVGPRYNIPPGTRPLVMHGFGKDAPSFERIFWGYMPTGWKRQPISNARLETIAAARWPWQWLMRENGRVIVPVDGWYEWKRLTDDPKGPKQPYYIYPVVDEPLFLAAVCNWRPGRDHGKEHGMAIVTNDAQGGMVDVHDRRPVALPPDLAREWIAPATSPERAADILHQGLPESHFRWHPVKRAVSNARYELPDAIDPAVTT